MYVYVYIIYTVYIRCFWQGNHQVYGHIRWIYVCRVGQNHTFISIHGVYTVLLAGKSPIIRSYTVYIYGSGQPYTHDTDLLEHN